MTQKIEFDNISEWQERLAHSSGIGEQIATALPLLAKVDNPGKDALIKESIMVINLTEMVQLLWDTTETPPGEAAGLTMEVADQESRLTVRKNLEFAIEMGEPVLERIQAMIKNP